jgi:hypothetical protein
MNHAAIKWLMLSNLQDSGQLTPVDLAVSEMKVHLPDKPN